KYKGAQRISAMLARLYPLLCRSSNVTGVRTVFNAAVRLCAGVRQCQSRSNAPRERAHLAPLGSIPKKLDFRESSAMIIIIVYTTDIHRARSYQPRKMLTVRTVFC